jgi:hypothetical protein
MGLGGIGDLKYVNPISISHRQALMIVIDHGPRSGDHGEGIRK